MADWKSRYTAFAKQDWKPTRLSSSDEAKFQKWLLDHPWLGQLQEQIAESDGKTIPKEELAQDVSGPDADYDMRGAWKAGIEPEPDPHDDNRLHWPDADPTGRMLKSPKHPTAWMEFFMQDHKTNPEELGLRSFDDAVQWESRKRADALQRMYPSAFFGGR